MAARCFLELFRVLLKRSSFLKLMLKGESNGRFQLLTHKISLFKI